MGNWEFKELHGAVRRTPQEAELFKDDEAGADDYAGNDQLVREVIQNSLDAKSKTTDGPVRVRLALHDEEDAPTADRLAYYFSRLRYAMEGRAFKFGSDDTPLEPCRFLVCEDFGTRGLEGCTTLYNDPDPSDPASQDFYWFWRNIGNSGKTGDDLGRWGLGKTVFRSVSRVGSMFGMTVRQSDEKKLVMGQVVLQSHDYSGVEYHPEGYWCDDSSEKLPLPIETGEEVEAFRKEWHLTRDGEAGTSIVSPFVPNELDERRLLRAVIVHFFTRILRGELEVEVCGPGAASVSVTKETICQIAEGVTWDGSVRMKLNAAPPLEYAQHCLEHSEIVETNLIGETGAPEFDENSIKAEILSNLRDSFADNKLVSIRVNIALPRRQGADMTGCLDVHLQRRDDGRRCDSYYVREGMTISKPNSKAGKQGVQALVIADPGPLANLLGDTEGPAHEDWKTSSDRPNKDWKKWNGRVKFARRIVDNLVEYLTPPTVGPDRDLLADFFSVDLSGGSQKKRQRGEEQNDLGVFPKVEAKPRWYQISQRQGGFTVSRNPKVEIPNDPVLRVAIAYDVPKGNPLRYWSPLDFKIGSKSSSLKPTGSGARVQLEQHNIAVLNIEGDTFSFAVDGFDLHRDLYVRVDDMTAYESTGEGVNHD